MDNVVQGKSTSSVSKDSNCSPQNTECVKRAGRRELSIKRHQVSQCQEAGNSPGAGTCNGSVSVRDEPPIKAQSWPLKLEIVPAWSRDISSSTMANLMLFYQLLTEKDFIMIVPSGMDFSSSFLSRGQLWQPQKKNLLFHLCWASSHKKGESYAASVTSLYSMGFF